MGGSRVWEKRQEIWKWLQETRTKTWKTDKKLDAANVLIQENTLSLDSREVVTRFQDVICNIWKETYDTKDHNQNEMIEKNHSTYNLFDNIQLHSLLSIWRRFPADEEFLPGFSDLDRKSLERIKRFCKGFKSKLNSYVHDRKLKGDRLNKAVCKITGRSI